MQFARASLDTCETATGTVVVIDVIRAFSTAAYAFAAGAPAIALVSSVEEAFALRRATPGALTMGEVDALPVAGFDFGNSPCSFEGMDLSRHLLIHRTSCGTQGVARSLRADTLLAASFCCAGPTVRFIRERRPERVTFVITGAHTAGHGDEDVACADYLEALLRGEEPEVGAFLERVCASPAGRMFADPARPEFPVIDLEYCLQVDKFDFAMLVQRRDGLLLMEAVR